MSPLYRHLIFLLLPLSMLLISGCIDANNSSDTINWSDGHLVCARGECAWVHNTNTLATPIPCFEWSQNKKDYVPCANNTSNSTLPLGI